MLATSATLLTLSLTTSGPLWLELNPTPAKSRYDKERKAISHITYLYPDPVERDYSLNPSWQVREDDDDDYEVFSIDDPVPETPLELAAKVSAKLNRAVALAELLENAQCPPKRTINNTLFVITGLIEEAVEDNENLRAKLLDQGPPRYG